MKDSIPPRAFTPRSTITFRSVPRTMAIFAWPRGQGAPGEIPQTGQRLPSLARSGAFGVIQGQAQAAGGQGHGRGVPHPLEEIPAVQLGVLYLFFIRGLLHGFPLSAVRNLAASSSAAASEVASCTPASVRPSTKTISNELSRTSTGRSPGEPGAWTFW